jgi:sugar diacid utilization regulator
VGGKTRPARTERTGLGVDALPESGQSPPNVSTPFALHAEGLGVRQHLARLQGLFVLAQLMAEGRDEDRLLHLAETAVPSLGQFQLLGVHLPESGWRDSAMAEMPSAQTDVVRQLARITGSGGRLAVPGQGWVWAFCLRSLVGLIGHMVISAESEPSPWGQFLLGTLAQLTAIAVANVRLYDRQRAQAIELQATVVALERGTAIHERLTKVAVAGEGEQGIAQALYELTGWPVGIEDHYGNLRAWGGPRPANPYPKPTQRARDELVRKARDAGRPIQDGNRILAVASPRPDVTGVIMIVGLPPGEAERAQVALEHGATVLAMELARLQSVAETELRLGRDLLEELLANTDERAALGRAQALGYDLRQRHRVAIVVEDPPKQRRDPDSRFDAVRRAARDAGLGTLLVPRGDAVVVLSSTEDVWEAFHQRLVREIGRNVWVGIGGQCKQLADFSRSYGEAGLAVRMRSADGKGRRLIFYEQLGTYRLLAEIDDLTAIDRFVDDWIGSLIAYDRDHSADLVSTLRTYLECKGNYDATAAALYVHRNTLRYRLRRIGDISGHDLKDANTSFNLQLATRAWSTRQALSLPDGDFGPQERTNRRLR